MQQRQVKIRSIVFYIGGLTDNIKITWLGIDDSNTDKGKALSTARLLIHEAALLTVFVDYIYTSHILIACTSCS